MTVPSPRLFDDFDRTDSEPMRDSEDSYTFYDRAAGPFWRKIRDELNRWFEEYPDEHAADLRGRFRDCASEQHYAAWWELYLHRLFRRLGFEVEVHPVLDGVRGQPDFRVRQGSQSFLLEAVTTFSGIVDEDRDEEREGWIIAALDHASNPDFYVGLDFDVAGRERPRVDEIVRPLERWLKTLDPDAVHGSDPENDPQLALAVRDWRMTFTAVARPAEERGHGQRVLEMLPVMSGTVNDVEQLRRGLSRKRKKYGVPEEPLVIAVLLTSSFARDKDVEEALLGSIAWQYRMGQPRSGRWVRQRNGFWMRGNRAHGTRVSGVIAGHCIWPHNVATSSPRWWPNPWATRPLDVELPFTAHLARPDGSVDHFGSTFTSGEALDLPADWPGPEPAFED